MGTKVFSSARSEVAVTPSDTTEVTCNALYVGTGGTVAINRGSGAVNYTNVPSGSYLLVDLKGDQVMSTGTTASSIVAVTW